MIKLIYGEKGTGKTKQIIDEANVSVDTSKGVVAFITDSNKYMFSLSHKIRLIDSNEYEIRTIDSLLGFVKGVIAGNSDINYIYIDGAARMTSSAVAEMEDFYLGLESIVNAHNINAILTVSCAGDKLPIFLKKYI